MPPWLVWVPLLAAINLFVFVAVRGRWGRMAMALALASLMGVVAGDGIADAIGFDLLRIGDMHVLAASLGAQLLMLAVLLLSALGPVRIRD